MQWISSHSIRQISGVFLLLVGVTLEVPCRGENVLAVNLIVSPFRYTSVVTGG